MVTNMFPPHHYGGYELSCADAVRRWTSAGHRVSVLTSSIAVPGAGEETHPGVRRELTLYWDDHELVSPPPVKRLAIEVHNRRALSRALHDTAPEVVSVWNMGALSLGLLARIRETRLPVVFVIGDDWPNYAPDLDGWSRMFRGPRRERAGAAFTFLTGLPTVASDPSAMGACLFNSRAMFDVVARAGRWSMPVRGIVYTGVETADFPVAPDGAPIRTRPWGWRLLYVGRLDRRKGVDTAVRAMPFLPGAHLRVVGQGDHAYLAELRRLADRLAVAERVAFTSARRADLPAEYAAADVVVFPSVYPEPFGIVPLEAMACDTPVAATGTGGSGEYLVDGWNCLRFDAGDEAALARAVRRLSDDETRHRLVRSGRRTARQLTTEAWMVALTAWHESALGRFRDGGPPDRQLDLGPGGSEEEGPGPHPAQHLPGQGGGVTGGLEDADPDGARG